MFGLVPAGVVDGFVRELRALEFTEAGSAQAVEAARAELHCALASCFGHDMFLHVAVGDGSYVTKRIRFADDITLRCMLRAKPAQVCVGYASLASSDTGLATLPVTHRRDGVYYDFGAAFGVTILFPLGRYLEGSAGLRFI